MPTKMEQAGKTHDSFGAYNYAQQKSSKKKQKHTS